MYFLLLAWANSLMLKYQSQQGDDGNDSQLEQLERLRSKIPPPLHDYPY